MVLVVSLSVALAGAATEIPIPGFETYFGFDWVRFTPDVTRIPSFDGHGVSAQFVYNFQKGIGITFDVGAVTKDTLKSTFSDSQSYFFNRAALRLLQSLAVYAIRRSSVRRWPWLGEHRCLPI